MFSAITFQTIQATLSRFFKKPDECQRKCEVEKRIKLCQKRIDNISKVSMLIYNNISLEFTEPNFPKLFNETEINDNKKE